MTPVRIIQTFVRVCADCPNCTYYSGGMYRCSLTEEMIRPDDKPYTVGDQCPLPYAGPPTPAAPSSQTNVIGWQAIEAAPKDRTKILLWCDSWLHPVMGYWSPTFNAWLEYGSRDTKANAATHWHVVPTPAPPTTTYGDAKLHQWSQGGVCRDCGCSFAGISRVDPCPGQTPAPETRKVGS